MKEVYKEESNMSDILMEIVNEDALSISGDIMNEGSITFTGALKEHIDEKRVTISDSAMEVDDTHDLDARKSANDAIVATDGAIDLTSDDDVIILDVSNNIVSMKTAIDLTLGSTVKQSDVTIDLTGDDGLSISDAALKHVTANVIDPDVAMEGVKGNIIYVSDVAKGVTVDDVVISSGVAKDSTNEDVNIPNLCMKPTNVEAGGTTGESTDGGGVSLTDAANAAVSDVAEYVNDDAFSSPEVPLKVLSTSQMARISIDQGLATEEANLRTHLTSIDSRRSRISHLHAVVQAKILHATTYDDVVEAVEALNPNSADAIDQIFHVEHVLMAWSSHIVTLKTKWSSITDPLEKFSGDDVDGIRKLRETVIRCRKEVRKYISLVASHRFKSVASESTEKLSFLS
ncbi:hypothetical protein BC829DRAFT_293527 [Chytridium lagenaria]|nr:hypothetical protein BC829DRAFT_293527 [Chytridium lagenaria]